MPKPAPTTSAECDVRTFVRHLLPQYVVTSRWAVEQLRHHSGVSDLLAAWHGGELAQRGRICDPRIVWDFHGRGVRLRYGGGEVDVDFGDNGEVGRFDVWRIWLFGVRHRPELTYKQVEAALDDLIEVGEVMQVAAFGPPFAIAGDAEAASSTRDRVDLAERQARLYDAGSPAKAELRSN